jgi:hypothetical protein
MRSLRWPAAVAAAALLSGLVAAAPAAAATPVTITNVSVSAKTVAAPGQVTVSYTAESQSPITSAGAGYVDTRNRYRSISLTAGPSGSGTRDLPADSESGTWRMVSFTISTEDGSMARWCDPQWATTSSNCLEVKDLSAWDFTVAGVTPEYDAPQLATVTVTTPWATIRPNTPFRVGFTLRTPAPDLSFARAVFTDPNGAQSMVSEDSVSSASPSLTVWAPLDAVNGVHRLSSLKLCDKMGNCAEYRPDGTVTLVGGARTPTGVQPTYSASVRVYDDTVAPVLNWVRTTSATLPFGQPVRVQYSVSDEQATLPSVRVGYRLSELEGIDLTRSGAPLSGIVVDTPRRLGVHRLAFVELDDGYQYVTYRRDGSVWDSRFGTQIGTHTLDFSKLDIRVVPNAPRITARTWPHGVKVTPVITNVSESGQITSHTVVAEPGHHVATIQGTNVSSTVLKGLAAGTTYTVSVTANGPGGASAPTKFTTTPLLTSSVVGAGDLNRDGRSDVVGVVRESGYAYAYKGNGRGGFTGGATSAANTIHGGRILPAGDLNGDGRADLLAENRGTLQLYRGNGRGGYYTDPSTAGRGWGGMRFITGGGDFSGDGRSDVVGVTSSGALYLYRGNGRGGLGTGTQIGTGWGAMAGVFSPGDFNGDRTRDLLAVDRAGVLWLYPGNGKGRLKGTKSKVGTGWAGLAMVGPLGDFTGDGRADLLGITQDGRALVYPGTGRGRVGTSRPLGTGWQKYF